MENITEYNDYKCENKVEGLLGSILSNHNLKVVEDVKTFTSRQPRDERNTDERRWEIPRDTLVSNFQHEINIFNFDNDEERKEYIKYWKNPESTNKDKQLHWLEEDAVLGDKNTYSRRYVKEVWDYTYKINEEKPTKKDKNGKIVDNKKRVKDELLGYEIDVMIGSIPLFGRILNETKDGEPILKPVTKKDTNKKSPTFGETIKVYEDDGVTQKKVKTWRNSTIKNPDGTPLSEEQVKQLLPSLKDSFADENYKDELVTIMKAMKNPKKDDDNSQTNNNSETNDNSEIEDDSMTELDSYGSASSTS